MTTFHNTTASCPLCSSDVEVSHLMSTNTFGGQDTDFRSHAGGFDPLYIVINQCETCGYSDFSSYFDDPRPMDAALKDRIREAITPSTSKKASEKYATAAKIAEIRTAPADEIANLYLRAAWCCADEGDQPGEMNHRKQALLRFETALNKNIVDADQRPAITYLVGELYRRTGDDTLAHEWFNRVIAMCDDNPNSPAQFCEIARRQRDTPQDRF
ncbi:MAG: DUF2225 domain-containing protein [Chloroflexota bacterium]